MLSKLTTKHKIMIGVFAALTILIPTGSYVISQSINKPQETPVEFGTQFPVTSPKEVPKDAPQSKLEKDVKEATASENPITVNPTSADNATLYLAPAIGFKIILQGRPESDQTSKVFLGIASGQPTTNPKYLLSFVLNVPASGIVKDFSLPGLDTGVSFTAYLKGPSQIATASAFVSRNAPIDLGTQSMLTGDVNDDNIINTSDQELLKSVLGTSTSSPKWNPIYDFNLDQRINTLDLVILTKNMGRIGASGPWMSGIPQATKSATLSGSLNPDTGAPGLDLDAEKGYWMWVPTVF